LRIQFARIAHMKWLMWRLNSSGALKKAGEHSGNSIHLDVDPNKTQDVIWTF